MFTKRFPGRYWQTSAFPAGQRDASSTEAICMSSAVATGTMVVRGLVSTSGARWSAKVGGIFLMGIVLVCVYSRYTPPSDGIDKTLLDLIVFGAASASSIGGFAFSALCGAALFHTQMDRVEVVQIMLMSSIAIQLLMITAIWRSINWLQLCRFLIGGLVGIPLGLFILLHVDRRLFAAGVGALLCAYSAYLILRRPFAASTRLAWLDLLVGFAGGITGGAVAFPGAPVTAWCQLKGWTREQQRGIYQPYILIMQIASLSLMPVLGKAAGGPGFALRHLTSVPPALLGALIGIYIYKRATDRAFLIIINTTLFVSGLTLLF